MRSLSTSTQLYQDFVGIEEGAYRTLVHFYESQIAEISLLNFDIYFEILVDYTNALFEIGAYSKHLKEVDEVIRLSIENNIQFYKGEDIYFKSLFQKAASYYNTLQYQQAEYILRELIRMSPHTGLPILFLKKCLIQNQPNYIKKARATSIVLFMLTALIALIEVVILYPFAPHQITLFEYVRYGTLSLGVLILAGAFLFHRTQVNHQVNQFVKTVKVASNK